MDRTRPPTASPRPLVLVYVRVTRNYVRPEAIRRYSDRRSRSYSGRFFSARAGICHCSCGRPMGHISGSSLSCVQESVEFSMILDKDWIRMILVAYTHDGMRAAGLKASAGRLRTSSGVRDNARNAIRIWRNRAKVNWYVHHLSRGRYVANNKNITTTRYHGGAQ